MRLGGCYNAETIDQLEPLCAKLDAAGLSAIRAPNRLLEMTDEEAAAFGEAARRLDLVIGETGYWQNIQPDSRDEQQRAIATVRAMLSKAERMQCRCVAMLVGSRHPSGSFAAPHAENYTDAFRASTRETLLRMVDGLDLQHTCIALEPWPPSFFYRPDDCAAFFESVEDPRVRLHFDPMNMVSFDTFFDTTALFGRMFDQFDGRIASVHLKDVAWDNGHSGAFLKWDEVLIGDGVMDYTALLQKLATLPDDITCYCEHLPDEAVYLENFRRLHTTADAAGVEFKRRRAAN